jgi:hypothetical protein
MTRTRIEHWARDIIERLKKGQPIEDAGVELKADWIPDHRDAARRIAAQANAARGEPVLFLFGVDQKARKVSGATNVDTADWYAQVKRHFDGFAPVLHDHLFEVDGLAVAALQFDSDAAPFVVRTGQSKPDFEVPWREGTSLRSARRGDLLRLLVPLSRRPDIEVLAAGIELLYKGSERTDERLGGTYNITSTLRLYITPRSAERVVIPFHRCSMRSRIADAGPWRDLRPWGSTESGASIKSTRHDIVVDGPGAFFVQGVLAVENLEGAQADANGEVQLDLGFTGTDDRMAFSMTAGNRRNDGHRLLYGTQF